MSHHNQPLTSRKKIFFSAGAVFVLFLVIVSCNNAPSSSDMVSKPEQMNVTVAARLEEYLAHAQADSGRVNDSVRLRQPAMVNLMYEKRNRKPLWSDKENWQLAGQQLMAYIDSARYQGLFPEDYHVTDLLALRQKFSNDSLGKSDRANAALWAHADLLLTDAFVQIVSDLKMGRLQTDSVTTRRDSVIAEAIYLEKLDELRQKGNPVAVLQPLEPKSKAYHRLKEGLKSFLDSADFSSKFTFVPAPGKDSLRFRKALQQRLFEAGFIGSNQPPADSAALAAAVKKYQLQKGLKADGKAGEAVLRSLNSSDRERFIRIAITLDRYKLLDEVMPRKYIWVNLPSFYLQLVENDSARIVSRVIVGKPATRTPVLTSAINELITYPTWTPPSSIIQKEILPAVKRNPGYLARRGFKLVNGRGETIDPYAVNWSKYTKSMPYRVVQNSGDANALGIMKFNFPNKYAVYLHDTNQRYLFGNASRAMSHGCVRVQEWEKLTWYILRNDSLQAKGGAVRSDSVRNWLSEKKFRKVPVQQKIPVYLRYFTCEGKNGKVIFYDDIYGEDKKLREQYFANK